MRLAKRRRRAHHPRYTPLAKVPDPAIRDAGLRRFLALKFLTASSSAGPSIVPLWLAARRTQGLLTLMWPAITAIALLYLISFWAIFTGVFEIVAAIRLRKLIANEWLLLLMGALSALFGLLILFAPGAGALAIVLWIGVYALMFGIVLLALAFRLRGHRRLTTVPT
jgi:uncharacterized membrane protein HdeD (DUF308 family)